MSTIVYGSEKGLRSLFEVLCTLCQSQRMSERTVSGAPRLSAGVDQQKINFA